MKRILLALLACFILASCGHRSLSGTYVPKGGGVGNGIVIEKMEFSGDEVTLTMLEQKIRANYKIDAKQLLIIVNGQQEVFDIDGDGCLDGGGMWGKFYKS
jgi:hypothetical protein